MTAVVLLALALGGLAAGILVGRYYVPDDRALKRSARHAQSYVKTINLLLARKQDAAVDELVQVVAENVDDVEPYFALAALFRSRGEWERAIRVHQAIELREQKDKDICLRARYQLGLDFRAAGMPRRATRAMEECIADDPKHEGALLALSGLYEEQGRFSEAAACWRRLKKQGADSYDESRELHLLCAAAQRSIERNDLDSAKRYLKDAAAINQSNPHLLVARAELAMARGKWDKVVELLKHAIRVRPDLVTYLKGPLRAAQIECRAEASHEERDRAATQDSVDALVELASERNDDAVLSLAAAELDAELDSKRALEALERLAEEHPALLPARVAAGRAALASQDSERVNKELAALVGEHGALEWARIGSWRCEHCGAAQQEFVWRCSECRQWATSQLDLGPVQRERSLASRDRRGRDRQGLLEGARALPVPRLASGMSEAELDRAGENKSVLGRAGQWLSGAIGTVRGSKGDSDDE